MKIRYLKTEEKFELEVPDPLDENETIVVKISDYDLVSYLKGLKVELDDDTSRGLELLCKKYILSPRILKLAKTQLHLRKLNRVDSSWIDLPKKKRGRRNLSQEDLERIEYLKVNYDKIVENCLKHDWFDEFYKLNKDINASMRKKEIIEKWRELKKTFAYVRA